MRALGTVTCLALASCGRLGFDGAPAPDATPDALAPRFDPERGNCAAADAGPLSQVTKFGATAPGFGIWSAPPYLLLADTTAGLRSVRLDGEVFTELDRLPDLAWAEAVFPVGDVFMVGSPGTGLSVVQLGDDGDLTVLAQDRAVLAEARRGWADNDTVFVPSGLAGLFALAGSSLQQRGVATSLSFAQGAWARDGRVLFADGDRFRVLDWDGVVFADVVTPDTRYTATSRIWSDGTTIFVTYSGGLVALRVVGSTLEEIATFPTTGGAGRDVWSDGQHVFLAADGAGLYILTFANDTFTELEHVQTGATLGVIGDGTLIYTNDETGVRAYSGFACREVF